MLDLIIKTDLKTLPEVIEFNYAELKDGVKSYLQNFQNLVVTEEGIKDAERDRSNINKMVKAIATARINTKKQVLKPFEDFESKCKELEGLGKDASEALDVQLRSFEQKRIDDKMKDINSWMAEMLTEAFADEKDLKAAYWNGYLTDNCSLAKTGNWLLKGMTEEKIRAAIEERIAAYKQGVETLATLFGEDAELHAKAMIDFRRTCDFNAVVSFMNRYKKEREEIEAAKKARAEAEARAAAEREARLAAEQKAKEAAEAAKTPTQPAVEGVVPPPTGTDAKDAPVEAPKMLSFTLKVSGTRDQLVALNKFMKDNGIVYEKVV